MSPAELLRDLVGISSVSSESNARVVAYLREFFARLGWQTRELAYTDEAGVTKSNLLASPRPFEGECVEAELAVVCHTDTVPYAASWAGATELTERTPGMLHGCGACDVKGFMAAMLCAAAALGGESPERRLVMVFTADEEVGCRGARRMLEAGVLRARYAVVGEPTSLRPARAGKGYCLARVTVHGRAAHSAYPAAGRSAIAGTARMIGMIEGAARELEAMQHPSFDPPFTTVNVGEIRGGTAKNVVPAECTFLVEWRPVPGQEPRLVANRLEAMAAELSSELELRVEVEVVRLDEGFETGVESAVVRALLKQGAGTEPITVAFGTEAPWLAKMGAEAVVVGPGSMLTAHSDRECVPVAELEGAVRMLRGTILELCG